MKIKTNGLVSTMKVKTRIRAGNVGGTDGLPVPLGANGITACTAGGGDGLPGPLGGNGIAAR